MRYFRLYPVAAQSSSSIAVLPVLAARRYLVTIATSIS